MKKNISNESGQSTIEFIFTFVFGLSVIFLIFNSAMNYTTGYLVHYATYMASRVYLTADTSLGSIVDVDGSFRDAATRSQEVFSKYQLNIFGINNSAFQLNEVTGAIGNPSEYLKVGGYTVFEQKIDAIGRIAGQQTLQMVSESFLGKEPTRAVCAKRTCDALAGASNCSLLDITLYDNGC